MKTLFPKMLDRPEKTMSIAGLIYGVICFYTLPFLALFFSGGFQDDASLSWFELVYHAINFAVAVLLFRTYLKDSWFYVQYNIGPFCKVVAVCVGLIIVYVTALYVLAIVLMSDNVLFGAYGSLPLVEMELFNLTENFVYVNPVGGLLSALVLAPVTMSCIYYASSFAPVCVEHPWLAYLAVTVVLAVPRALSALTFWQLDQNLILYLAQLPIHWIACYAYQKTDTVWGAIATHVVANAVASVFYLLPI